MCCLFGFYNYSGKEIKGLNDLTNILAKQATERGKDATGIAYTVNGKMFVHKEAKSAFNVDFKHNDNIVCVTGHTRHATQGDKMKNFNNHPFVGVCKNERFALAHNGVLINDEELKTKYKLPKTKIATDSFVAVQLIEKEKKLNNESIKFMTECLNGSFAFSILDTKDTLWLIRGDNPIALIHLPKYKLYVYASTEEILYKSLVDTKFFDEIKRGNFEEIPLYAGDFLSISSDGTIVYDKFNYTDYSNWYNCRWWSYEEGINKNAYIDDLKSVAVYQGYSSDDIDELIRNGFTFEEIEEYIYCY